MYRDAAQWLYIRSLILEKGKSRRQVARDTGVSRGTVRKMLANPLPSPYGPRKYAHPKLAPYIASLEILIKENVTCSPHDEKSIRDIYRVLSGENGISLSYSAVRDYIKFHLTSTDNIWVEIYNILIGMPENDAIEVLASLSTTSPPLLSEQRGRELLIQSRCEKPQAGKRTKRGLERDAAFKWMLSVLQKTISVDEMNDLSNDLIDAQSIIRKIYDGRLSDRNRSLTILAHNKGIPRSFICEFLGINKSTCKAFLDAFADEGAKSLFARKVRSTRKTEDEITKAAVFRTLHEPPSAHGFNRTSWRMADLCAVLDRRGTPACPQVVRAITKAAGYRWCKARTVLTSSDPNYAEKLAGIRAILSGLQPDEAFFSIDEFGPFSVRMRAGRKLVPHGEVLTVPQHQKSRGSLILTAALELSSNQITHFYSDAKNTDEMLRMLDRLLLQYRDKRRIVLSWDAASWHVAKRLNARIAEHNAEVMLKGGPLVETAPLPSGAQFLNVIEAVFSGMARAIIHNSDYADTDAAKVAIDRYLGDRNAAFLRHPQRAGRKIWGKEPAPATFSDAGNFKDPLFR